MAIEGGRMATGGAQLRERGATTFTISRKRACFTNWATECGLHSRGSVLGERAVSACCWLSGVRVVRHKTVRVNRVVARLGSW